MRGDDELIRFLDMKNLFLFGTNDDLESCDEEKDKSFGNLVPDILLFG